MRTTARLLTAASIESASAKAATAAPALHPPKRSATAAPIRVIAAAPLDGRRAHPEDVSRRAGNMKVELHARRLARSTSMTQTVPFRTARVEPMAPALRGAVFGASSNVGSAFERIERIQY